MKMDFHTHGKLSKKMPFSEVYTRWLFQEAKRSGLDAICLTEHFNTQEFERLYEYVTQYCQVDGDSYVTPENLRIFLGLEVDIQEGGHTLIIGNKATILRLHKQLTPYHQKADFLTIDELYALIESENVIFGAAHPYRLGSNIPNLTHKQLGYFHFFDLNGKDLAKNKYCHEVISELSKQYQKPYLGGSDTHQATQYGVVYNEFMAEMTTINQLYTAICQADYTVRIAPTLKMQVEQAGMQKKLLKYIHKLGGECDFILFDE